MPPALVVLADDAATLDRLDPVLDTARRVGGVGRVLLFSPAELEPRLTAKALGFRLWPAEGEGPGERFANAFRQAGQLGYEGAVVVRNGGPELTAERLTEAATLLGQHHGVVGSDGSGGIALLGLQQHEPTLFPPGPAMPSLDAILTRARQQRVGLVELDGAPD